MTTFSWTHRVDEISTTARPHRHIASEKERATFVDILELTDCLYFEANFELQAKSEGKIALSGTFHAKGHQACVITLEPVAFDIKKPVVVTFEPDGDQPVDLEEIDIDALGEDDVEPYSGDMIDVAPVFFDHFSAALDPYPKMPGAALPSMEGDEDEASAHPFAALKSLKDQDR